MLETPIDLGLWLGGHKAKRWRHLVLIASGCAVFLRTGLRRIDSSFRYSKILSKVIKNELHSRILAQVSANLHSGRLFCYHLYIVDRV